jgi:predicted nucleic acid-binding protein
VIIFDSSYLVVLLHPNPAPAKDRENKPVSQFKERVAHLTATMDTSNDTIGVPTPAMAEVLVRSGTARPKYVSVLSDTWKFQILPFDSRAAIEAADLIAAIKSRKEKWETWAKVKFDIQIVSIAKAESATLIYSDDKDIENFAKRFNIRVVRICDLPLPPTEEEKAIELGPTGSQGMLALSPELPKQQNIESKPEVKNAAETAAIPVPDAGSTKASNELQTDSSHPAPVQGSDGGRAQGEAAGEKQAPKEKTR